MIKRIAGLAVTTLAVTAGSLGLTTAPAHAVGHDYRGKVVSKINLTTRLVPTTASEAIGSAKPGQRVHLFCKVRGNSVDGNNIWYAYPGANKWVSARYVANIGAAPRWCGSDQKLAIGQTIATLNEHTGPSTAASRVGLLTRGTKVKIACGVYGPRVDGNPRWYWLASSHRWVSARYVANIRAAPDLCS
jgi:uncharacterized protein YraI